MAVLACAPAAQAQNSEAPALRTHHVTVSGGIMWSGGYSIGDATARLRTNAAGSPPPFTLFTTASAVEAATGVEGRVGFALTSRIAVEAGASYSTPAIGVTISQDAEGASQALDGEHIEQFVLDVGVRWHLPVRPGPRMRLFAGGGAAYLRQLHEARTLVETGQIYYADGGITYWLRGVAGRSRALGLRGEVRANWRRQGIDFENLTRVYPSIAAAMFIGL